MKERSKRRQQERLTKIKRIIKISLTASIVLFLAVFFAFVPFRLLLPAYKIAKRGEGELRLHFLDLNGGVTIVEFPDGEALVVNAGDGLFSSDNTLCRYLRALDPTSVSVVATSNASSHVGGMPALFEVFPIKAAYLPALSSDTGSYNRFLTAVQKEGCEAVRLARYGVIENSSGAYAVCLSPYSNEKEGVTPEESSTMLYLSYAGVSAVLAGDVTQKRENQLVNEYSLSSTIFDSGQYQVRLEETKILGVSSHGSDSGSGENFLSLLNPSASVVCCNRTQHPSSNTLKRLAQYSEKIYRTDELGAVMITIKDGDFEVSSGVLKK